MASAAITVIEQPATIESDTNEAVITKGLGQMTGTLVNAGETDVWCVVSKSGAASGVVTTGAQAQFQFPLPSGASVPWLSHYATIAHKTAADTSILAWFPDKEYNR
jgi:hypothetical protein